MTGPQPAGRRWTRAEEIQLRELIASKVKVLIAKKLKRSPGAIYARIEGIRLVQVFGQTAREEKGLESASEEVR
jgi:hypothetical protein